MSAPAIDVRYVADLARLKLSPEEIDQYQRQLADILGYVAQLQQVDVSSVEETFSMEVSANNLRADILGASLTPEQALANAPQQAQQLIVVPKIVE
jgi:aspartyl-tRNA(Asn)/glutamyl-tRNA(Gln) amidotransferase subunit C